MASAFLYAPVFSHFSAGAKIKWDVRRFSSAAGGVAPLIGAGHLTRVHDYGARGSPGRIKRISRARRKAQSKGLILWERR